MDGIPAVSVCIATYNHAQYLPKCMDSILVQTYQNFEIVVVDDGSQDGSQELLLKYQSEFPEKVKYHCHPGHVNKGVSISSNLAIEESIGEYIAFIGSDDMWYPDKLRLQVEILDNNPEIGFVYGNAEYIDESDRSFPGIVGGDITHEANPLGKMLVINYTPAMTVIVRRKCLDRIGLFVDNFAYSDWDLMVKLFAHWKAAYVKEPLAKYRVHGKNMSIGVDPKLTLKRNFEVLFSLKDNATQIGGGLLDPKNLAILDLQIAFHHFCDGNEQEAIKYLNTAFDKDPKVYSDPDSISQWSSNWRQDFYHVNSKHFGFWAAANLPSATQSDEIKRELIAQLLENPATKVFFVEQGIQWCKSHPEPNNPLDIFLDYGAPSPFPGKMKKDVLKSIYSALLFENYQIGDLKGTRHFWKKAVLSDTSLLTNRGVISVGIKSLFRILILMSTNSQKVCVIIPAYNQAHYVTEAVESVLSQSFSDFELVVVDDGSTDDTPRILAGFQDARMRVIRQENGGLSAARNTGIRESRAPLITLLDADDFFLPDKLAVLSEFLERNPGIGMVSGGLLLVDPDSRPISQVEKNPGGLEMPDLLFHNPYTPSAVMFRRSWLDKVGVFDPNLKACEDWDMWLRMAYAGCRFAWVEQILAAYRFHAQQMTRESERMRKAIFFMLDKFYSQADLSFTFRDLQDQVYAAAWVFSAAFAYLAEEVEKGETFLANAITRDPTLQEDHNKRLLDMLLAWSSDPRAADAVRFLDRIIANLPPDQAGLKKDLQRATGDVLLERIFKCPPEERRVHKGELMKAIRYKPDWLLNRGVLRILADAWLG